MAPNKRDVQSMVAALFTMNAGLERARRQRKGASILSLLQVIGDYDGIRPSAVADIQNVHPSLVTRQVRELEDGGLVTVTADPADRRSCLVALTPAGSTELTRLAEFGLQRFAEFVKDWDPTEVRALADLLEKLKASMASVTALEEPRPVSRRWAQQHPG